MGFGRGYYGKRRPGSRSRLKPRNVKRNRKRSLANTDNGGATGQQIATIKRLDPEMPTQGLTYTQAQEIITWMTSQ